MRVISEKVKKEQALQAMVLLLFAAVLILFMLYQNSRVYRECYVEAGVEIKVQDFLKNPKENAVFGEKSDSIDINRPGRYCVVVDREYFSNTSILNVVDSIAPKGEAEKVKLDLGDVCEADSFVAYIEDATEVKATFAEEPDFSKTGKQEVEILLTDLGGNQTKLSSELFISQVVSELTVEAGSKPPKLSDFVIEGEKAVFISDMQSYDYTIPADKTVTLRVDGTVYKVVMHIVDTIAPKIAVKDLQAFTLLPRKAEDFVVSVDDATEVTMEFLKEPNLKKEGEQTVEIAVTDAGGNQTVKQAKLILKEDTEAPVITGVTDLNVVIGTSISYKKNVTVTDNCPEGLSFTVDNSAVNPDVTGTYPIKYIAEDYAGNVTTAEANITIRQRVYDENEIYAMTDRVLARIITPEMAPIEKVKAIYDYIMSHVSYINNSEKGNWLRGAYEGLVDGKGDCYVFASTAKAMLSRAGIVNMDIAKIPTKTSHYWNLVNLGDGWYHFDTTPRVDHPTIFMWTEAELVAYSDKNNGSHNYDRSLYPAVN